MRKIVTVIGFAGVFAAMAASPGMAADARNGRLLAIRWCASCHLVEPNQSGPAGEAPTFASMAKAPDFDAKRLAFFLLEPHPKMPDMALSRRAAEDLAAYIATQK